MEIRLKYKYRNGHAPGTYWYAPKYNKHSDNGLVGTKRRKLTGKRLDAARAVTAAHKPVKVLLANGKVRLRRG